MIGKGVLQTIYRFNPSVLPKHLGNYCYCYCGAALTSSSSCDLRIEPSTMSKPF